MRPAEHSLEVGLDVDFIIFMEANEFPHAEVNGIESDL
jgi:hypothetical protein